MKQYFLIFAILSVTVLSCTKNITDLNIETKRPAVVPGATLFSNGTKTLADGLANASVNINVWRFTVKHWAATTYPEESQYDFFTRNINGGWWNRLYRDVLADMKQGAQLINDDLLLDEATKKNQLATIEIMQVYGYSILVNTFGNIPYTQAIDIDATLLPAYDDAATVYDDLLSRLVAAINNLDPSAPAFSSTEDLIYAGDVSKWIKFANTLRFKMGMLLADSDPDKARSHVEAADAGAFTSNDDNALLNYFPTPPNTNPLYADIIIGGRGDYVAAKDLMDVLQNLNDPRIPFYFQPNGSDQYAGGVVGQGNPIANFSTPSDVVSAADSPLDFMDYSELEFLRAEAVERGFAVSGTALEHYTNAITASISYWGGTMEQATLYLANPEVNYLTAPGTWKEKIGLQKWIGLYNRPYDGWTELRRLDFPVLSPPVAAISGFPNRFRYPSNEQLVNRDNYTAAAAAIGGDEVETKLFWDVN